MGRDYKLIQIADASKFVYRYVNLIGVVLETSIPKHSRGTDYVCTIRIVDETNSNQGITVNVFAENMGKLPHVNLAGDIIQFFLVEVSQLNGTPHILTRFNSKMIRRYDGEIYAVFNKKFSAFALFEGKRSTTHAPYQASENFHSRGDQYKKLIEELRKWSSCNQLDGGTNRILSLREIKAKVKLNVMCKVLHVIEVSDNKSIAFLWDGTDTPTTLVKNKLQDERENPLKLQLEPVTIPRDVLCALPTVGTVIWAIIDQRIEELDLRFLKTVKWAVFVNIMFEIEAGLWQAMLVPSTKLRLLSDDDSLTVQLQRNHDERFSSTWGRMPLSYLPCCFLITDADHRDVPYVTLMDILSHPEVTAKFRCVVRVVSLVPGRAEQFRNPEGTLRIRLTLDDPTARIHAYVYAEDGDMFFGTNCSTDVMKKMRNKLLGVITNEDGEEMEEAPRNPPWIDCCIKSYYLDENDKWGTRNYRIFDTKVVKY